MSIIGTIHEDVTTEVLGVFGSWQTLATGLCSILMVPVIFNQHEDLFLLRPSSGVMCIPTANDKISNISICSYTVGSEDLACLRWDIKLVWLVWIKKHWFIFCDDKMKLLSTAIICRLGSVFGCVIFGLVADSFGRKKAILVDVFAEIILRLITVFSDTEGWFRLFTFLRALFGSANIYMGLIIICEIASNSWRTMLISVVMLPHLLAKLFNVPLANSFPNMESYAFIASIFGGGLILVLRWTPESPQWLLYNRKIAAAEKLLSDAANRNGIQFSGQFRIRPVDYRAYGVLDQTASCIGVVTTNNIRALIVIIIFFWFLYFFLWSSVYIRVYSKNDAKDIISLSVFVLVAGLLTFLLAQKLKLRYLLMITVGVTGVFSSSMVICEQEILHNILSAIALGSSLLGYAVSMNITPRLFAINVRATLFGCCHAAGQFGVIIGYLLSYFHNLTEIVFMSISIGVSILLLLMCYIMPDVDGRELPDVMEDMDYFAELTKPLRWATQKTTSASKEEMVIKIYSYGSAGLESSVTSEGTRPPAAPITCLRLWQSLKNMVWNIVSATFGLLKR